MFPYETHDNDISVDRNTTGQNLLKSFVAKPHFNYCEIMYNIYFFHLKYVVVLFMAEKSTTKGHKLCTSGY